jgi:alpha-beta hydrolase superfamily lysophospholipase
MPEPLRAAIGKGALEFLAGPDGYGVPVRAYGLSGGKTPVVLTHGLQSHSGWFAQSAAFLAGLGHPAYALDRRGSGLSGAPRGDVKDYRTWAEEILTVAAEARQRHGTAQVYLVGHCFGAIPAAVFAGAHPELVKGLILTTPGLYTRTSVTTGQALRIFFSAAGERDYYLPVPLETRWFSELPEFEAFVAGDPLALRAATGDLYWEIHRARRAVAQPDALRMPLWMGLAGEDPIADNEANEAWFLRVPSPRKTLVRYVDARHVLEFSPVRERFFGDIAAWLAWVEGS